LSRPRSPGIGRLTPARTKGPARTEGSESGTEVCAERADSDGLRSAFAAHGGELFGFARRSLGDANLAEDAVQETFTRAWRSRHRFDPELGSLRTWLFTIERRVVIDLANRRSLSRTDELGNEAAGTDDRAEQVMAGWQVEEAMRRLRPEHRAVIYDVYFRSMSGREVASRLGIPEGTVRSRLFYALRSLRLVLEEMGWDR